MLGFGSKEVDVKEHLEIIARILDSNKIDFKRVLQSAGEIRNFVEYYVKERGFQTHKVKLRFLQTFLDLFNKFISSCQKEKEAEARSYFKLAREEIDKYASYGSVYLLRHPDKSKVKGLSLSAMGVRQANQVARLIKEEILLSPKPVRLEIYTSELTRTKLFGEVINFISRSKKIMEITQKQDERLFMGPLSDAVNSRYTKLAKELGAEKGVFEGFSEWIERRDTFGEEIGKGGIRDPREVKAGIDSFVQYASGKAAIQNTYTIIIAISHSWILDTWFYQYTGIQEIVSTAEYVKIEFGDLFYKGSWRPVRITLQGTIGKRRLVA